MGLRSSADIVIVQKLDNRDLSQTKIGHVAQSFGSVLREMGMVSTRATLKLNDTGNVGWMAIEGWKEELKTHEMGPSPLE